jgi:hypothetical protein
MLCGMEYEPAMFSGFAHAHYRGMFSPRGESSHDSAQNLHVHPVELELAHSYTQAVCNNSATRTAELQQPPPITWTMGVARALCKTELSLSLLPFHNILLTIHSLTIQNRHAGSVSRWCIRRLRPSHQVQTSARIR